MQIPCDDATLMSKLNENLTSSCGKGAESAERIKDLLLWWRRTCGIELSGYTVEKEAKPFGLKEIDENVKFPKNIFRRLSEEEQRMGIRELRYTARKKCFTYTQDVCCIVVTGEFVGVPRTDEISLMVMIYNDGGDLIGYDEMPYSCQYEGEINTFDSSITVPADEWISAVEIRFMWQPNLF